MVNINFVRINPREIALAPKKHFSSSPEEAEVIKWGKFPQGSWEAFITLSDSLSQHNIKQRRRRESKRTPLRFWGRLAVIEPERVCKSGCGIWPPAGSPLYSTLWKTPHAVNIHVHVNQHRSLVPNLSSAPCEEQSYCSDFTGSHRRRCWQETGWMTDTRSKQNQIIQCPEVLW